MNIDLTYFEDMSLKLEDNVLYLHFKIFANLPEDFTCYSVLYGRQEGQVLVDNLRDIACKIENRIKGLEE